MNERAILLYKEACEFAYGVCKNEGRSGGHSDHIWNTLSTGRFAELIVKECADKVTRQLQVFDIDGNFLLEHFGVEE